MGCVTAQGFVVGGEPGALRGGAADEGHDDAAQQQRGEGSCGGHPSTTRTPLFSSSMASTPPHLRSFQHLPAAHGNWRRSCCCCRLQLHSLKRNGNGLLFFFGRQAYIAAVGTAAFKHWPHLSVLEEGGALRMGPLLSDTLVSTRCVSHNERGVVARGL